MRCFLMVHNTRGDEVQQKDLTDEEWPMFQEAIQKEVTSMLDKNKALTPMSVVESARIRHEEPDRIIPSRLALRRKTVDDEKGIHYQAKARWIMVGFHDPDVFSLETTSPTPQLQTINIFLSAAAGLKEEIFQGDLEEAFLQGKPVGRTLYASQPPSGIPGLHPEQLLKLEKEVY